MKKSILLSFVLILSVSFASPNSLLTDKLPSPFVVIPQPQNVILLNGPGLNTGVLKNLLIKGDIKRPVMGNLLSQLNGAQAGNKGTLSLILDKMTTSLPSEEGYILNIYTDRAEVISKGEAGYRQAGPV